MEKAQAWLQENFGILLGVCAGVAVIEVCPSLPSSLPPGICLTYPSPTALALLLSCKLSGPCASRAALIWLCDVRLGTVPLWAFFSSLPVCLRMVVTRAQCGAVWQGPGA